MEIIMNPIILTIIATICLTFSGLAIILGTIAYAKVIGMANSTHSVQYVPMDPLVDRQNEDYLKKQQGMGWATDSDALDEQNKLFKEDLEDLMPEFAEDEEEKKIYSF